MSRRFPELHDPEWLRREYCERYRTRTEIAGIIGCSKSAVDAACRRHGIPRVPTAMLRVYRARLDRERDEEGMA